VNIYDQAIYVQDACNISGVALFLTKCIRHIRDVEGVTDTDAIREHPLVTMVVNKLDDMAHYTDRRYGPAYGACKFRSEDHIHDAVHDLADSEKLPGHPQPAVLCEA